MLRSPILPKPRASLPASTLSRTSATSRTTLMSARPRSATPATNYVQSRLPTPSTALQPDPGSRRRSSTLVNDRTTTRSKLVATAPAPLPTRRKSSEVATKDDPLDAQYKRRGLVRASDTPTLGRDRARSRTSPPRSVYAAEPYPTPPSSIGPSLSRRTTYRAARTPTLAVRALPSTGSLSSYSRPLPSSTLPLKVRRRTQTSSTRAVRWQPRSPSPGVLLLLDEIASFQNQWSQLFSDSDFERAWSAFLDVHAEEHVKYVAQHEDRSITSRTVRPGRRLSVPSAKVQSLRPTLGVELDEDKILRRKSPVTDIFSMLSRDARPVGRLERLSNPPQVPLPEVPSNLARGRLSKDSVVSVSSNIRSSVATTISSTRPDSTASVAPTLNSTLLVESSARLSSFSTGTAPREAITSSDSDSSLYSVTSTFTEISSSPPSDKHLHRNAILPAYVPAHLPTPPDETSPNPLGLVGVPRGYFDGTARSPNQDLDAGYSTNQAFALTDSPLDLSEHASPPAVGFRSSLTPPIGGNLRGIAATPGPRSRQITASLVNTHTPHENPRRPSLRSASLQPTQRPVRTGSLRGQVHRLFDRRASETESLTSKSTAGRRYTDTESLKSRISGPSVTMVGIAVDGLDGMLDLRNISVEEEDGSVYDDSSEE